MRLTYSSLLLLVDRDSIHHLQLGHQFSALRAVDDAHAPNRVLNVALFVGLNIDVALQPAKSQDSNTICQFTMQVLKQAVVGCLLVEAKESLQAEDNF